MAVYAFDGTWNEADTTGEAGGLRDTNVYRFLKYYAPNDREAQEAVASYLPGVGTRKGKAGRVIGGGFGVGGRSRVKEMIDAFKLNWKDNGPEDRTVDVIGFSRGAALAIHFCNQLAKGVKIDRDEVVKPEVRFLGLWDVVCAFGLPGVLSSRFAEINIGWDLDAPPNVKHCFHAMALDERRAAFNVHRLDPENDDRPRIQEVWFRGVHSDVGGGNGNVARSNTALKWMLERAAECGLPIAKAEAAKLTGDPDATISTNKKQLKMIDRPIYDDDEFHSTALNRLEIGEKVTVEVDSRLRLDPSGLCVKRGDRYLLTPDPAGKWKDKTIVCDATGWPKGADLEKTVKSWLTRKFLTSNTLALTKRVRDANWFEMVVSAGPDIKHASPLGHSQFKKQPWTAPATGPLFFFANDARPRGLGRDFYENNEGSINVTIERVV